MKRPEIVSMDVAALKPAPYNPRRIDSAAMAGLESSMERFGIVEPVIWNRRTGYVVGGHQRLKILRLKKVKATDVVVVDLDETDERALNVALNNPHIAGTFSGKLDALLAEINDKNATLFAQLRLGELLGAGGKGPALLGDPNDAPPPPKTPVSKLGDLWVLGRHRLLCGDSTQPESVQRVLNSANVDQVVTDPPYGVDYAGKNEMLNALDDGKRIQKPIANDAITAYRSWFASWLAIIPWATYATFHIFMAGLTLHELRGAIDDVGLTWGDYLIWVKNNHVLGRKDYNSKHEFILYGWPKRHRFYGKARTTILPFDRPLKSDLHPTMKPVELLQQLLEDGSADGATVLDLFGGSGSTLIACEASARRAHLIELDPAYCDVIIERWQTLTGEKAKRAS